MPRTCTICSHAQRGEIDSALVRPDSLRAIAGRFGTSKSALERHRDKCVSQQLAKAQELSDVAAASVLVKELKELTKKASEVLARAMREKNGDLALKAIGRLEKQLELKARLLGQLEDRGAASTTTVQVVYIDATKTESRIRNDERFSAQTPLPVVDASFQTLEDEAK